MERELKITRIDEIRVKKDFSVGMNVGERKDNDS